MRHYHIERTTEGVIADVIDSTHRGGGYELDPRFDLRRHSLSGYEFGFAGSGPAQLSLALLADALSNDETAKRFYMDFKNKVIARLKGDHFELSQEDIIQTVAQLAKARAR